jgi:hypothetical protein
MIVFRESVGSGGTRPNWICRRAFFLLRFKPGHFLFGHRGQFGFRRLGFKQFAVFFQVGNGFQVGIAGGDQLFQPGVFSRQFLRVLRVVEQLGIAQFGLDLGKAPAEFFDVRTQLHG